MKKSLYFLIVLTLLLGACGQQAQTTPTVTQSAQPTEAALPSPIVQTTSLPDPEFMAERFFEAWQIENYQAMYDLLCATSKDAISLEDFSKRYTDLATTMTLQKFEPRVTSSLTNPGNAQVAYHVKYITAVLGEIERDMVMNMTWENERWLIKWDPTMIMPELTGGNVLKIDYRVPERGEIFDRNGQVLVGQTTAYALGIVPGAIISTEEGTLQQELAILTNNTREGIFKMYESAVGQDWYVPIGDASAKAYQARQHILSGLDGLRATEYTARYYYNEGVAPHAIGYAQPIYKEQLDEYKRLGYRGDEFIGQTGIEKWGDQYLSGQHGGALYVVDPQGVVVTRLAETPAVPAESITTTIDTALQLPLQATINTFRGAIVVLERDTGRVLTLASGPEFNPNLFNYGNFNSQFQLRDLLNSPDQPTLNRATQGLYPLGSVFKIITMAAALESGLFYPSTQYDCGYEFLELPGMVLYDWTKTKEVPPSGMLTLQEGLMRSCNPYFYHIGLVLFDQGGGSLIPEMARGFGLGSPTGIGQVAEDVGNVPDITNSPDSVQLAIGQGQLLVTPLQVAAFVAAVGNGGTLYKPQLVEKITTLDGEDTFTFKPEVNGTLPVSEENLKYITDAMAMVVDDKRGTAYNVFRGLGIKIHAKTGTASNENVNASHAFFAGYTDQNLPNKPDIAIAVLAENAGEGSEIAAPIFRRVVEIYFLGAAQKKLPWESSLYVNSTPTPVTNATPAP